MSEKVQLIAEAEVKKDIQHYFGKHLFKHACLYEKINILHAKYLQFSHQKIPSLKTPLTPFRRIPVQQLTLGSNQHIQITLQIIRTLRHSNFISCLTIQNSPLIKESSFYTLIIVYEHHFNMAKSAPQNMFLSTVRVRNPFKSNKEMLQSKQSFILARSQNVFFKRKYVPAETCEKIKGEGNLRFKQKKYIEALFYYERCLGLATDPCKNRQRAILYANTSLCLQQMGLFNSADNSAEAATFIDKTYIKGFFRKLNAALQTLPQGGVRILSSLYKIGSKKQSQEANHKYSTYIGNNGGYFNWISMFKGTYFGSYKLNKVNLLQEDNNFVLIADSQIKKFELIIIQKPRLVPIAVGESRQKSTEKLINLAELYQKYDYDFQLRYQDFVKCMMSMNESPSLKNSQEKMKRLLRDKYHRSIQTVRSLQKKGSKQPQQIGMWQNLSYFEHSCFPNCTYFHIKDSIAVFALKDINKKEVLSIDFMSWSINNKKKTLFQKFGNQCSCLFCNSGYEYYQQYLQEFYSNKKLISSLYLCLGKIELIRLWKFISVNSFTEEQILQQLLKSFEDHAEWESIINCVDYLRNNPTKPFFDILKAKIKRLFQKYLQFGPSEAEQLLKYLL